jgi:hypothetical protein
VKGVEQKKLSNIFYGNVLSHNWLGKILILYGRKKLELDKIASYKKILVLEVLLML